MSSDKLSSGFIQMFKEQLPLGINHWKMTGAEMWPNYQLKVKGRKHGGISNKKKKQKEKDTTNMFAAHV